MTRSYQFFFKLFVLLMMGNTTVNNNNHHRMGNTMHVVKSSGGIFNLSGYSKQGWFCFYGINFHNFFYSCKETFKYCSVDHGVNYRLKHLTCSPLISLGLRSFIHTRLTHCCTKYHGQTGTACILSLCPKTIPKPFDFPF